MPVTKGLRKLLAVTFALIWLGSSMISRPAGAETAQAAAAEGRAYYVDCSAAGQGDGTLASPFSTLAAANGVTLQPGESMLFKRGIVCMGEFAPKGSGTAQQPIKIGAYGTGTMKPVINANGQVNAVLLNNMKYVQLDGLELTAPGDNRSPRRGVYVLGTDAGDLNGVTISNLTIHDVRGQMPSTMGGSASAGKFKNASGGIVVEAQGTVTPTAYHDMQIINNQISAVDRQGIYFWSNWCKRSELSRWGTDCTAQWYPHTNVVISGNELSDIGGDGIVPKMTDGALVEHNTLQGFNVRSKSYNAGMWTANSDNIIFQYNRTSGGVSTLDGMAYDIDHATNHVVFQYNLSYNNEGGFFLFCPDTANTKNFTIRYNVSINDRTQAFMQGCGGKIVNGKIYNNTIYIGSGLSPKVYAQNGAPIQNVEFFNNVVYKTGTGSVGWGVNSSELKLDHNLFYNVSSVPSWATNTVTSDPLLTNPGNLDPGGYRLKDNSPALGAGILIPDNGGRDYYGNAVSAQAAPNVGAYEGAGIPALPGEGCSPTLQAVMSASGLAPGSTRLTVTVSNPCSTAFTGLKLSAKGPGGLAVSPAETALETLAPGASLTASIELTPSTDRAFATYPVELSLSDAQGRKLAASSIEVELIASLWQTVQREDFEGMTAGQPPAGWSSSGTMQPIVAESAGSQSLKLVQSPGVVNKSVWSFPEQAGALRLVTKVQAGQKNIPLGIHYLDAQDGEVLKLSLNLSGNISYTNKGTFIDTSTPYTAAKWQTLEAIVDSVTGDYLIYLDGVRVGKGSLGPSAKPVSKLRLQVPAGNASGTFLVDEVRIEVPGKAEAGSRTILTGPATVNAGETFGVQLGMNHAGQPLTAQDITLLYNPEFLRYEGIQGKAEGMSIAAEKAEQAGVLRLIAASEGMKGAIQGNRPELYELRFRAAQAGSADTARIEVVSAVSGDSEGREYAAEPAALVILMNPSSGVKGDLNGDGRISIGDLAIIAANYGKSSSSPDWESIRKADINQDGSVGLEDLAALAHLLVL
ncbi:NEW3 domain-containing protein [Paenibacillus sp. SAF-054]|uniref:NEW3 domain-containing protein n=1 Tax=Paenibacillus sp. SAF-054 TaxID=3436863 RepID=UPI003F81827E